jgi:hypothetical protein
MDIILENWGMMHAELILLQEIGVPERLAERCRDWVAFHSSHAAILVRPHLAGKIKWSRTECRHWCAIMLNSHSLFVSCYLPDSHKSDAVFSEAIHSLDSFLEEVWQHDPWRVICVAGDLNVFVPAAGGVRTDRAILVERLAEKHVLQWSSIECGYTHVSYVDKGRTVLDYVLSGGSNLRSAQCDVRHTLNVSCGKISGISLVLVIP